MKRARVAISNEMISELDLESKDISEWAKILHAPQTAKVIECQPSESGMCRYLIIEDENLPHLEGIRNYTPTIHVLKGSLNVDYKWIWGAPYR